MYLYTRHRHALMQDSPTPARGGHEGLGCGIAVGIARVGLVGCNGHVLRFYPAIEGAQLSAADEAGVDANPCKRATFWRNRGALSGATRRTKPVLVNPQLPPTRSLHS